MDGPVSSGEPSQGHLAHGRVASRHMPQQGRGQTREAAQQTKHMGRMHATGVKRTGQLSAGGRGDANGGPLSMTSPSALVTEQARPRALNCTLSWVRCVVSASQ